MEEWRDIKGYEGKYKISSHGRVKSLPKEGNAYKEVMLKPLITNKGYSRVCLFKNNSRKYVSIHRLVADTFISNPYNKPQVNHIDGNKTNNKVDNLEWCNQSENELHAHKIGLKHTRKEISSYIDGTFEKHFKSTAEAKEWLISEGYKNADSSYISKVCRGERISAYGRVWKYE